MSGYLVDFRVNRALPTRRVGPGDIKAPIGAFVDVNGVRGFDPLTRSSRPKLCYDQAVALDEAVAPRPDMGTDERSGIVLPTRPTTRVRVTVSSYRGSFGEKGFQITGTLSTTVRVRPFDPPPPANDDSKSPGQVAAGC